MVHPGRACSFVATKDGLNGTRSRQSEMGRLLFIGSGFSIHLGMPSWSHLLKTAARPLVSPARFAAISRQLETPGQEYKVASNLSRVDNQAFEKAVIDELRRCQDQIRRDKLLPWNVTISKMGVNGILTT